MRRPPKRPKSALDKAVLMLQTSSIPYRLDTDKGTGGFQLFIQGASIPQVYDNEGKPVQHQPGKAR